MTTSGLKQKEPWQSLAKAKKESLSASIPMKWHIAKPLPSAEEQRDFTGNYLWQYLSENEKKITETDAESIVRNTSEGHWTAVEVVKAFAHRAALAHQLVNCLHEVFFDIAIENAELLDAYYAQHKKPVGPLHGLPISLKDQFHVKGAQTTMGYVGWIGTFEGKTGTGLEKSFESEMVRELRDLGAVFFCKTSVPQTLMMGETLNNIHGHTSNPKNRYLGCGGSSGGEGALIALKGSPLGFGTDIGGSIRIPAMSNGIFGIRPSSGRMPYEGMANSMDGQNTVLSVVGPLSSSIGGLRFAMKSLLSQEPWLYDPLVHEIPWREDHERQVQNILESTGNDRLVLAVMKNDGVATPHPPVRRAVEDVVRTLEQLGHKVLDWEPPSHKRGSEFCTKSWTYDGGENIHQALRLSGEPIIAALKGMYGTEPFSQTSASEIAENNVEKRKYQKEYMDYWNSTSKFTGTGRPVDALILPVAPFSAARPGKYKYSGYTAIFNSLDYPVCVIPVTTVKKEVDVADKDFKGFNDLDNSISNDYDPEIYDGAPVGLQIVGRRLQEEKVLAVAEYVANSLKGCRLGHKSRI